MAFTSTQVATSATAAALFAFEATNSGNVQDPIPFIVTFSVDSYVGGPGVTTANGYLVKANSPLAVQVFGASEIPYAITVSGGAGIAYVLVGRQ